MYRAKGEGWQFFCVFARVVVLAFRAAMLISFLCGSWFYPRAVMPAVTFANEEHGALPEKMFLRSCAAASGQE